MATKWFDYRFLHPEEATHLFARAYVAMFHEAWAKYEDRNEAGLKRPISASSIESDGSARTALWVARQAADRLGIPYDFFCRAGITICMDKGYEQLPLPNQLYGEELLNQVSEVWNEETSARLFHADDERFLVRHWCDHPAQQDHARWLVAQAALRAHPQFILREVIFDRPMVLEDSARSLLPGRERLVDQAQKERPFPEALPPHREVEVVSGCFGMPHGFSSGNPFCAGCPSASSCAREMESVLTEVEREHGSRTPVEQRKREQARLRKKAQRERERTVKAERAPQG